MTDHLGLRNMTFASLNDLTDADVLFEALLNRPYDQSVVFGFRPRNDEFGWDFLVTIKEARWEDVVGNEPTRENVETWVRAEYDRAAGA